MTEVACVEALAHYPGRASRASLEAEASSSIPGERARARSGGLKDRTVNGTSTSCGRLSIAF